MGKNDFGLYIDENISKGLAEHLKEDHNLNIKCAKSLGKSGHADSRVLQEANKLNRLLLTNDEDFIKDHHKFPFKNLVGIIKINESKEFDACQDIDVLCSHRSLKEIYGKKIIISKNRIKLLSQNKEGSIKEEDIKEGECPCKLNLDKK